MDMAMRKRRIMIVEDEQLIARDIKSRLQQSGYSVVGIVSSGKDAIQKASEAKPDLVLMDIVLKGNMDGIEAAKKIRDRFDIPIIYLTAHADQSKLERAKMTEPVGYVVKPFQHKDLRFSIEIALSKHEKERKLRKESRLLFDMFNSMSDGVIITNDNSLVTFMNHSAEALTRCTVQKALGKHLGEFFKTNVKATGEDKGKRASIITKDRRKSFIDLSSTTIRDETGKSLGAVLVLREVFNFEQWMNKPQKFVSDAKMGGKSIKLMVASPYALIKEVIEGMLEYQTDIEVVAHASSCSEIIPVLGQKKPDVLFLDTEIASFNVVEMLKLIREKSAVTKILLFFHSLDEELVLNGLHLGVRGYMAYESSIELLLKAARALSRDEFWMDVNVMSKILNHLLPLGKFNPALKNKLTKKEKEIVQFVLEGLSNKQISDKLFVSENTVKNHLAKIFSKLQVSNRLDLVLSLSSRC